MREEVALHPACTSPITTTLDRWPLTGVFSLTWGCDALGELWVAVENSKGECRAFLPYEDYLEDTAGPVLRAGRNG